MLREHSTYLDEAGCQLGLLCLPEAIASRQVYAPLEGRRRLHRCQPGAVEAERHLSPEGEGRQASDLSWLYDRGLRPVRVDPCGTGARYKIWRTARVVWRFLRRWPERV